jgi:hypothetical protein
VPKIYLLHSAVVSSELRSDFREGFVWMISGDIRTKCTKHEIGETEREREIRYICIYM